MPGSLDREFALQPIPAEPLVTVVTACRNAAQFLKRTIDSVMAQDYPRIEYLILDGASTDGTAEVAAHYGERLQFISEPDRNVVNALNKGLQRARGEIVGYLHADDVYTPQAISTAVRGFLEAPRGGVVYGEAQWIDECGTVIADYPTGDATLENLARSCVICQPASFLRREAVLDVGGFQEGWATTFDYELWFRLMRRYGWKRVPQLMALSRMHRSSISFANRKRVLNESVALIKAHAGFVDFERIYSCAEHLETGHDQFFEPQTVSARAYLMSLFMGLGVNRDQPLRYLRSWISPLSFGAVRRYLSRDTHNS